MTATDGCQGGRTEFPKDLLHREQFEIPTRLNKITPEFLTRVLQHHAAGLKVLSVTSGDLDEGTGSRARIALQYNRAGEAAGLPRTMWIKSCFNDFREHLIAMNMMVGEAVFYRLAPKLPMRAPRAYYAGFDATGQGLVLLEDLAASGSTFGTAGSPLDEFLVRDGLDQLARLHGSFWGAECVPDPDAAWPVLPTQGPLGERIYRDVIPRLDEFRCQPHLEGRLPAEVLSGDRFGAAVAKLLEMSATEPHCLLHFDPHLGNLCVNSAGRAVFVDWQLFRMGGWFHDVAYFLSGALEPSDRRRWESDLLKYYLDRLALHGGHPPNFEIAWHQYSAAQVYGVLSWVVARPAMQSLSTIFTFLERHVEAMTDHDSLALLA